MDEIPTGRIPLDDIPATMLALVESASSARVFAAPVTSGDRVIVPAAAVSASFGFGFGGGGGRGAADKGEVGGGGGGGGGGRSTARPVAVIDLGPAGVQIHPVIDQTRIAIAALVAVAILVIAGRRAVRGGGAAASQIARLLPHIL